ncbi:sensor histidine kinase [Flagellimonas meridianipacifica]|uniref:Histidine kinase n=1 Tax=Flagellimonas meridianipacifica TaxID=1080225 RepID=A0A2T0MHJ7_9FLAO|nr:histidine kinase [Allomuricauda pacifica]PRX57034.1 histidine kinase [Allomuricauda pacifica]
MRLAIALVTSSILFLMIWVFSQFREPPGFNILMNTLLVFMAFVCLESIRVTQRSISKWNLESIPYVKNILVFVLPVLVGTLVYSVLFYFFKWFDYYLLGSEPPLPPHMISAGLIGLVLSLIFGLVLWVVTWKDSYYNALIKTETYRTEMINANLHTLRNQMDPHFLFNNFNTVYYLIDENPSVAKKFLKNVSNIYRHVLNHSNENLIEAKEEYEVMLQHVEVLKERFGRALELKNEVNGNHLKEKHLPPLVLHELVENVVKHNRIDDENHIVLKLMSTPDNLMLSNNRNPKKVAYSTKNGLRNIIARYDLLTESKVLVEKDVDCFQVKIPLIVAGHES